MAFNDEWARLKADTATRMRLNGAGGGSQDRLVVHQDDLGRVGHDAFELHGRLGKAADVARGGGEGVTAKAARVLGQHNFATGSALSAAVTVWGDQVKTLMQACAHISNHLDFTKATHAEDDAQIAASLRHRDGSAVSVSEISKYFD